MKRTADITVEKDFEFTGEITKSYVDAETGKRYIVGAASGLEEDREGERVSKRAINGMVNGVRQDQVALVGGTHEQNWLTEIGRAVEAHIDPETDQFMVKTELPPEGADPIADKAWSETHKRKMGFSIGGKLQSAFYELTDVGKKRKVLDSIRLKHLCLTDKPAYQHGFAQAVAKTFDGPEPEEAEFEEREEPEVEKDLTTGGWSAEGGRNSGNDSKGSGERNNGPRGSKAKSPDVQDDKSAENDDNDTPLEDAGRHLACPNCGHEFAAELPVDMSPQEREKQDASKDDPQKSTEATIMDLTKTVDELKALVAKHLSETPEGEEASTEPEPAETSETPVAKTEEVDTPDVLKMVAASHAEHEERFARIEKTMGEALGLIADNLQTIKGQLAATPVGRKSIARVLPASVGERAQLTGDGEVGKTHDPDEPRSAKDALKDLNERAYGIR